VYTLYGTSPMLLIILAFSPFSIPHTFWLLLK
jgi:hypothetical protein